MAKRKGESRSELIRQYLEQHPEAPTKEICEALKQHNVSYQLAAKVRSDWLAAQGMRPTRGRKTRGRKPGRKPATVQKGAVNLDSLELAAQLVDKCGGVDQAQQVLNVVSHVAAVTAGKKK